MAANEHAFSALLRKQLKKTRAEVETRKFSGSILSLGHPRPSA